jgi:hypothetical protein
MFFAKAFGIFFIISFGGGVLMYSLLALISERLLGHPWVFGAVYRMFPYHWAHPFQYIFIVATVYSLLASTWATFWSDASGWRRWLQITLVLGISIMASSIPGGILWKFHDMQAGFFPEGSRMVSDFLWGAEAGLWVGPVIVLLSIPLNALALISGYVVTHRVPRYLKSRGGGSDTLRAAPNNGMHPTANSVALIRKTRMLV